MEYLFPFLLIFAIVSGQLIKIPFGNGGVILLDITLFLLCFYGLLKSRFIFKPSPLWFKYALLFISAQILSLVFTPLDLTINEYLISSSYIIRFVIFILFAYFIYMKILKSISERGDYILIFSGALVAILGILQFIFIPDIGFLISDRWDPHYFRTVSTFLDPNFVGAFLGLTLLSLYVNQKNIKKWYFIFALVYLALVTTYSRGAYLTFGVSFLVLSLLQRSLKLFILSIILVLGLYIGFSTYQQRIAEPKNIQRDVSAKSRFDTWQQGLEIYQKNPIFGVGFNAYRFALKEYNLASDQFLTERGATTNDSSILFILATTGLVGFLSFILFFISLIYQKNYILTAGLVGLLTQSFFSNVLFYPLILIWILLQAAKTSE